VKSYVCGFMFDEAYRMVVLILKSKPAWQLGKFNGIGGSIEAGETPDQAMIREFFEETGLKTEASEWTEICHYINPEVYEVHFFRSFSDQIWEVSTTAPEEGEVSVCRLNPLPTNVISNLNWLIPMALDEHLSWDRPITIFEGQMTVKPKGEK
jgi:8-oxo-dGTP diphosphatase